MACLLSRGPSPPLGNTAVAGSFAIPSSCVILVNIILSVHLSLLPTSLIPMAQLTLTFDEHLYGGKP